ncbi:hypothetical protein PG999_012990 [Apiospora kogelbergensis]|uniref:NAD(P)-dependent dehydrogenase, short-chain alcohol dehydrogenase family n=1 Tax=Apiospora kogelbergensis TaxID=1337665 RepID=A0AAW0QAX2_9PEZI
MGDLPELSQAGKNVLITGGGGGIGLHIAKAFLQASAAKVVVVGRRDDSQVMGLQCDIAKSADVERVWGVLKTQGVHIDVLVLNAAVAPAKFGPILELGTKGVVDIFGINMFGCLEMTEHFHKQEGSSAGSTKYLVHVSTVAAHNFAAASHMYAYGLSKNSGALALQLIAQDTKREAMQIVTFNPGPVFTPGAASTGVKEEDFAFNNADLPGQFAVWAASPEAAFLHGRFVWNEWDVDEMKSGELRKKIDEDPTFLQIGVHGI